MEEFLETGSVPEMDEVKHIYQRICEHWKSWTLKFMLYRWKTLFPSCTFCHSLGWGNILHNPSLSSQRSSISSLATLGLSTAWPGQFSKLQGFLPCTRSFSFPPLYYQVQGPTGVDRLEDCREGEEQGWGLVWQSPSGDFLTFSNHPKLIPFLSWQPTWGP